MKTCPNCGKAIKGHPNKKFCHQRCKDKYHNRTNPRGIFAHLAGREPNYDDAHDDELNSDHGSKDW